MVKQAGPVSNPVSCAIFRPIHHEGFSTAQSDRLRTNGGKGFAAQSPWLVALYSLSCQILIFEKVVDSAVTKRVRQCRYHRSVAS